MVAALTAHFRLTAEECTEFLPSGRQWRIRARDLEAFLVEPEPTSTDAEVL